jgi:Bacterial Ig domain/Bacterial Ig-like domain
MKLALVLVIEFLAFAAPAFAVPPPAPIVEAPAPNAETKSPVAFRGTAEAGGTIRIKENAADRGTATVAADGKWAAEITETGTASHTYDVTVTNAAGEESAATTLTVRVDAEAPERPVITSPADGSAQNSTTVTLSGIADAATVEVFETGVSKGTAPVVAGHWALTISGETEATHTYTATAKDTAGNVSVASPESSVTVDLTPPPAPVISGTPDAFVITALEGTLDCRLDSAAGPGTFGACGSRYDDLAPGDYTLVARATDAAGNASTAQRAFTLSAPPPVFSATPTPTPVATPAAVPSFRRSVVLRPATGRTLIRRPGAGAFEVLRSKTAVPLGTAVNVKDGTVVLTATPAPAAKVQNARLFGGIFTISQPASGIELALSETLRCGRTRQLVADGAGTFRIRGRYGTATGRGAKWQVQDACSSTTVRVTRGVVAVATKRTKKTILVRAGRHYTARSNR